MNERRLPLSRVTLVFGVLSLVLAFVRQLCVPATIMGVLAIAFHLWGWRRQRAGGYSPQSVKWSLLGFRLALAGTVAALVMWVLWATNVLLR
ncbi:MAG: hypothetical protein QM724_08260 [Flavobacteriales bacterium]